MMFSLKTISYTDENIEKFTLHELLDVNEKEYQNSHIKNAEGKFTQVYFKNGSLQSFIDEFEIPKKLKEDVWVEIVSKKGISQDKIVEILEEEYEFEE